MQILFIVLAPIDGNTSGVISNIGLINGLLELGHEVDVCTTKFYGTNIQEKKNYFIKKVNIYGMERDKAYKKAVSARNSRNLALKSTYTFLRKLYYKFKILDNFLPIAKSISLEEMEKKLGKKQYDLIISASDPKSSHRAVQNLIKQGIRYQKWIQYWGDPLMIDITKNTLYPNILLKYTEKKLLKDCDKIFYVSPFTRNMQKKIFREYSNKIEFEPLPYSEKKIYNIREIKTKNIVLGYFGDYTSTIRNIVPLYNLCCKNEKFYLEIAGNSDLKLENRKNINIHTRLKKEEIESKEENTDVLICILNSKGSQIPGKIYYSAATNKPILVIVDGENQKEKMEYLKKFKRFKLCSNNEKDIEKAINEICIENKSYEPSEEFSPAYIAKNILKKTYGNSYES